MQSIIERRLIEIRKGIHSFREVGNIKVKKEIANILVKEYENGTITDNALNSLIDYYIDQINIFKRINIVDVPESIRNKVVEKL